MTCFPSLSIFRRFCRFFNSTNSLEGRTETSSGAQVSLPAVEDNLERELVNSCSQEIFQETSLEEESFCRKTGLENVNISCSSSPTFSLSTDTPTVPRPALLSPSSASSSAFERVKSPTTKIIKFSKTPATTTIKSSPPPPATTTMKSSPPPPATTTTTTTTVITETSEFASTVKSKAETTLSSSTTSSAFSTTIPMLSRKESNLSFLSCDQHKKFKKNKQRKKRVKSKPNLSKKKGGVFSIIDRDSLLPKTEMFWTQHSHKKRENKNSNKTEAEKSNMRNILSSNNQLIRFTGNSKQHITSPKFQNQIALTNTSKALNGLTYNPLLFTSNPIKPPTRSLIKECRTPLEKLTVLELSFECFEKVQSYLTNSGKSKLAATSTTNYENMRQVYSHKKIIAVKHLNRSNDITYLMNKLTKCTNLKILSIHCCRKLMSQKYKIYEMGSNSWPEKKRDRDVLWKAIFSMKNLERLDLVDCDITGEIPTDIGKYLPRLKVCNLSHNKLTGVIPTSLRYMKNLQVLKLSFNQLSGQLEMKTFSTLFYLRELSLSYNQIEGKFPTFLFTYCPNLEILLLGFNKFSGVLPSKQRLRSLNLTKSWSRIDLDNTYKRKQNKLRKVMNNYDDVSFDYNLNDKNLFTPFPSRKSLNTNEYSPQRTPNINEYMESKDILVIANKGGMNARRRKKAMRKVQSTSSLQNFSNYSSMNSKRSTMEDSFYLQPKNPVNDIWSNDVSVSSSHHNIPKIKKSNDTCSSFPSKGQKERLRPFSAESRSPIHNLLSSYNRLGNKLQRRKYIGINFEEEYNKTALPTKPLPNLKIVYLSGNKFNGQLPGTFLAALRNVKKLYLNSNQLEGEIPSSIGELNRIDELVLSQNRFEGRLPLELIDLAHEQRKRRIAQHHSGFVSTSSSVNQTSRPSNQRIGSRQREGRIRENRPSSPKLLIELQDNDGLSLNGNETEMDSQTLRVISFLREYGCEVIA